MSGIHDIVARALGCNVSDVLSAREAGGVIVAVTTAGQKVQVHLHADGNAIESVRYVTGQAQAELEVRGVPQAPPSPAAQEELPPLEEQPGYDPGAYVPARQNVQSEGSDSAPPDEEAESGRASEPGSPFVDSEGEPPLLDTSAVT
jgi:hypothetical protein